MPKMYACVRYRRCNIPACVAKHKWRGEAQGAALGDKGLKHSSTVRPWPNHAGAEAADIARALPQVCLPLGSLSEVPDTVPTAPTFVMAGTVEHLQEATARGSQQVGRGGWGSRGEGGWGWMQECDMQWQVVWARCGAWSHLTCYHAHHVLLEGLRGLSSSSPSSLQHVCVLSSNAAALLRWTLASCSSCSKRNSRSCKLRFCSSSCAMYAACCSTVDLKLLGPASACCCCCCCASRTLQVVVASSASEQSAQSSRSSALRMSPALLPNRSRPAAAPISAAALSTFPYPFFHAVPAQQSSVRVSSGCT